MIANISTLITALEADDRRIHTLVVDNLVRIGQAAVEPLLMVLDDANPNVRAGAVCALGKLGDPQALGSLVFRLRNDPDPEVRKNAVWALHMGQQQAVPVLIEALADEDEWVRFGAVIVLSKLGQMAVTPLIEELHNPDPLIRANAAETLGRIGDRDAADSLVRTLDDMNDKVWQQAAISLGRMCDARSVHPLIAIIRDPASELRTKAVRALGQIRDVRAVEPLMEILYGNEDRWMRLFAIEALGQIGDMRAVEGLLDAAYDESRDMRTKAIVTLGVLQMDFASDALYSLVEDELEIDAEDRQTALFELGKKADSRSIAGLVDILLNDPRSDSRIYAALVLGEIEHRDVIPPLVTALNDRVQDVANHAMQGLVRMHHLSMDTLVKTLNTPTSETGRIWTVRTLGQIANEQAVDVLMSVALNGAEHGPVREEALEILRRLGHDPQTSQQ
ncbi:MAG: HEAT repeat domain-containing protein [Anaerolineae bacterium]|nr:HEAT repeat domain-containing protein [Anaerolineae bacterium]